MDSVSIEEGVDPGRDGYVRVLLWSGTIKIDQAAEV
jgi:hypothetical protein